MDKKLITSATRKLKLLDIVLHESSLTRNNEIDPLFYSHNLRQESKLGLVTRADYYSIEKDEEKKELIFRVFVTFGERAIDPEIEEDSDRNIYFEIEATYRIDYLVLKLLTKEEVEEFVSFNSVHNAWPFWRQHVFQTVNNAHLPSLDIPLMQGQILDKVKKKTRKKRSTKLDVAKV